SAYYVALAARRLGLEVGLLTSGAPDFPSAVIPPGITVATFSSPRTTPYRFGEAGGSRTLPPLSPAEDIEIHHLPRGRKSAPLGAITRGRRGATLYVNGEPYHVAPDRAAETDPTGAGDVFATTLLIEYQRVGDAWEAAAAAACAGAATVEGTGVAALLDRAGLAARLAAYQRRLVG